MNDTEKKARDRTKNLNRLIKVAGRVLKISRPLTKVLTSVITVVTETIIGRIKFNAFELELENLRSLIFELIDILKAGEEIIDTMLPIAAIPVGAGSFEDQLGDRSRQEAWKVLTDNAPIIEKSVQAANAILEVEDVLMEFADRLEGEFGVYNSAAKTQIRDIVFFDFNELKKARNSLRYRRERMENRGM